MEQRSLRVYDSEKTFFSKITNTISKILIPTKIGFNGMLITLKRNNLLKAYENFINLDEVEDASKKESIQNRYEESYSLYLESIDKYIMDSVYKKVKADAASSFEKNALSKYYMIVHLKENEYLEYKYRKQKYLIELDYETIKDKEKDKLKQRYNPFYISKMDTLYKGILKNYSIKLADNLSSKFENRDEIYDKIFSTIEEYITNILPLKMKLNKDLKKGITEEFDKFERFIVGKLDEQELIEKNIILLSISRKLFTHSLPLIASEQCYIKLLKDTRALIVNSKTKTKKEKAYNLLIQLIEEYNIKLLSTKVYWDKPEEREKYKLFWKKYQNIKSQKEKEILFIKTDLKILRKYNKYQEIKDFYKEKLIAYGEIRTSKNACKSKGKYKKAKLKNAKETTA